jgi:transcriptional regulator with XRE-family HTH domain
MQMNTQEKIAKNLRDIRKVKHMTQTEVAQKAKISTNHYAKIERAEVIATITTLERIIKSLGTSSSEVFPF